VNQCNRRSEAQERLNTTNKIEWRIQKEKASGIDVHIGFCSRNAEGIRHTCEHRIVSEVGVETTRSTTGAV